MAAVIARMMVFLLLNCHWLLRYHVGIDMDVDISDGKSLPSHHKMVVRRAYIIIQHTKVVRGAHCTPDHDSNASHASAMLFPCCPTLSQRFLSRPNAVPRLSYPRDTLRDQLPHPILHPRLFKTPQGNDRVHGRDR